MIFGRFILNNILLIFLVLGNPLRGGSCTEGGTDYSVDGHYCQWNYTGSDCCAYYSRDFDFDGWGWQAGGYHFADDVTAWNSASNAYNLVLKSGDLDFGSCPCQANTPVECYDCLGNCRYSSDIPGGTPTTSPEYIGDDLTPNDLRYSCTDPPELNGTGGELGCDACGTCNVT